MFEKEAHEVQKQIQQEYLDLGKMALILLYGSV